MKIALFHNLHPGGAKRALFEHARRLRERGHELDSYTLSTSAEHYLPLAPLCHRYKSFDFEPAPDPAGGFLRWLARQRRLLRLLPQDWRTLYASHVDVRRLHREQDELELLYRRMAAEIDAAGYDLVYVHQCHLSLSPALLRFLKTPTVYYAQDSLRYVYEWSAEEAPQWDARAETALIRQERGQTYTSSFAALLRRKEQQYVRSTRAANIVLVNSWFSREALLRTTGTNPHVCYLGVDSDFFSPDPAVARQPVVLSVGAIVPGKRHDFVIESAATIPGERRPLVRVVGYELQPMGGEPGPVARRLGDLARERGVQLQIDRDLPDEQLREAYRSAAVVAFAPYLEPFGFTSLEAMASETPVVGLSEGGLRETIREGVTGFLTGRDPGAFGAAIDRLANDPELARELGRAGRRDVLERWTWEKSVDELERWFGRVRDTAPAAS